MTLLPAWLIAELPEVRFIEFIDYDPLKEKFTYQGKDFDTILDAYRAVDNSDGKNFDYTQEALEAAGIEDDASILGPTYEGWWIAPYTDHHRMRHLELIYTRWLETDRKYRKDPENWTLAYHWINQHPVFWTRKDDEKTWDWYTDKGANLYTEVYTNNPEVKVCFEAGGHTPGYTGTYHDYELDVYADSFENAYIALAKNVDKFFNIDGTEKEGVRGNV